jgi:hypothetical protein
MIRLALIDDQPVLILYSTKTEIKDSPVVEHDYVTEKLYISIIKNWSRKSFCLFPIV